MSRLLRGENLLVLVLMTIVGVYVGDTLAGGFSVGNLAFVLPVGVIALGLGASVLVGQMRSPTQCPSTDGATPPAEPPPSRQGISPAVGMSVLLVALVLALDVAPFDVATWLFLLAGLWWLGERRTWFLVIYPLVTGFGIALVFRLLLPYPMDTLI
ncbi:MAG: tripartite tricarboxylate transporter TctB family protein [Ectothiorhodospiraceae bacterium]|nr:tripartite tricarboxylate transporter TctB family protein [Chromatiales bacterium]MCP5155969.1 tripartite tricarboxylate transporter TctB family protein [Ectothiorhodospiraceae bacterium]